MRRAFVAAALMIVSACAGADVAGAPSGDVVGNWELKSINDRQLPYTITKSSLSQVDVARDVVTLVRDGTYIRLTTGRTSLKGTYVDETTSDEGTFAVHGNTVTITSKLSGGSSTGEFTSSTITIVEQGYTFVYTRS